jgi:predicted Ser/Thr protein kinase
MSDPERDTASFSTSDSQSLRAAVARFRQAWQDGKSPNIEQFLPKEPENAHTALVELIQADLELRLQSGENARVENYLQRYPRLGGDSTALCGLVLTEYALRLRGQPELSPEEYYERFPNDRDALRSVLSASISMHRDVVVDETRPVAPTPVLASPEISEQSLPMQFGRFELRSLIGRGGFGSVYRAYDPELDRHVAVKIPHRGIFETESQLKRFLREARAGGRLHHPNVCPIYDVGQWEGFHYIVMAYIEGSPLSKFLRSGKPLDTKSAAKITLKLTSALDHAHELGIIHRDLKPSNILIEDKRKEPVILDFGLARDYIRDASQTQSGQVFGTPLYMSPEQARGASNEIGPKSDIYSLGIVLYEMLTGHPPFSGSTGEVFVQILTQPPTPPSQHNSSLDPRLETICLQAMAREPRQRFASMREFGRALKEYLTTPEESATAARVGTSARHGRESAARATSVTPVATAPGKGYKAAGKIEFTCPHCGLPVRTPMKTAGKKGQCPGCGQVVKIPHRPRQ